MHQSHTTRRQGMSRGQRNRGVRRPRVGSVMESLENRTHFSVVEPNHSLAQALTTRTLPIATAVTPQIIPVATPITPRIFPVATPVTRSGDSFAQAVTPYNDPSLDVTHIYDSVSTTTDPNDYYKFYNVDGKSRLRAVLYAPGDAIVSVYDQGHNFLGGSSSEVDADLPANQYFYVRVQALTGATDYQLRLINDYAGSTPATARDLGVSGGQHDYLDYLDASDNVDYVKFALEAPGTISLQGLTGGGNLVADMQLLDANGNVLSDVSGKVIDGLIVDRKPLNAGTYYVKLTQIKGAEEYTFRVVSDYAGDTTATA